MTKLLDHTARLGRLATLALLLALAACGPGTGGTGTGPIQATLVYGGATASSAVTAPGTACTAGCERVDLRLEDQRVELTAGCRRFIYAGSWAVDGNGLLVLGGTVETTTAAGVASAPGTLRLQFSERDAYSASVTVTLADAAGRVLLGPVTLPRGTVTVNTVAPACR